MKQQKRFFTLIEILTVAAIIAILAGISVGAVALISSKNAEAKTRATIKALEMALSQYKTDNGFVYLPGGSGNLKKPVKVLVPKDIPDDLKGTLLKYLDQQLLRSATVVDGDYRYFVDAWDRPLIFRFPGKFNTSSFDLGSVGPDGKVGEDGTEIPNTVPAALPAISNYDSKFGKGDDITNFLRKE